MDYLRGSLDYCLVGFAGLFSVNKKRKIDWRFVEGYCCNLFGLLITQVDNFVELMLREYQSFSSLFELFRDGARFLFWGFSRRFVRFNICLSSLPTVIFSSTKQQDYILGILQKLFMVLHG